jgi:predicted  nucleic acid-binding Zn-ribbon protein
MDQPTITAFQPAPQEASFKCLQCGNVLRLKKGQLVPPCPKCGFKEFRWTDEVPC